MERAKFHTVQREDAAGEYEQIVMCEVLIPNIPNCYGDIYTEQAIREFVYAYAYCGYGIDVDHDRVDIRNDKACVVESFIAREGDPTFIPGSWVIAMKIFDDDLWARVLDGTLNGFSFEAECYMYEVAIQNLRNRQIAGTTEPDPLDGHTHDFLVVTNALNQIISGGTGVSEGHSHRIVSHTKTEPALSVFGSGEHRHRYQVIVADNKESGE